MSKKQWTVEGTSKLPSGGFRLIYARKTLIPMLDRWLKLFVPALFSEIKIMDNKIRIEVPYQVAPRLVEYLRKYKYDVPLEVVGV